MNNQKKTSGELFEDAKQVIPGGISRNTVYRSPHPDYVDFGTGCTVTDQEGKTRVDFANNMASLIHGHAHPDIVSAVTDQLRCGTAFTMANLPELRLAELLCQRVPWFDKIRFMNSGTEAVMAAIKAARAITGRPGVAKAEGTYHGTYDHAEISQNSTPAYWGDEHQPKSVPVAKGTPSTTLDDVVVFPFNDAEQTVSLLNQHQDRLACILIDPVPHRAGLVPAKKNFIHAIRDWASRHDVLLVFDEVISFRMDFAGAAAWYDVEPDLTTLGKIIGGGFPVGALAGKDKYMSVLDPLQDNVPFPWSGTFSGNPVTMTAGRVALELFDESAVHRLNGLGELARMEIADLFERTGAKNSVTGAGSMFRIHMKPEPPTEYRSTWQNDEERQRTQLLVEFLYQHGFMMFRSCTAALSTATTESEIQRFVETLADALAPCDCL